MPINNHQTQMLTLNNHKNYKPWLVDLILFCFDAFSIIASFLLAEYFRILLLPILDGTVEMETLFPMAVMVFIIIIGLFITKGLYPAEGRTGVVEFKDIIYLITIAYVILGLAIFILKFGSQISRIVFITSYVLTTISISGFRLFIHNRGSLLSWWSRPAVIIGTRVEVDEIVTHLLHARRMAYKPTALLLLDRIPPSRAIQQIPAYKYSLENLRLVKQQGIELAILASSGNKSIQSQQQTLNELSITVKQVLYVLEKSPLGSLALETIDLEGHPVLRVNYHLMNKRIQRIKRLLDLLISIGSLVFVIPLTLLIAFLIRLDSTGPIFYTQTRIKKGGEQFKLYKFRTMEQDADQKLDDLLESNPDLQGEYQKFHKLKRDPRVTRVGHFLRKVKLDELPQIWNIIYGDMCLVGPRPYLPEEQYNVGEQLKIILRVSPGLTGWWQVMGSTTFNERVDLDIYYISNFSIWLDFYIIIKTLWIILSGQGK
jgi:Undecaprenyl-phosphate galactose phosphotransferase WbaP